MEKLKVTIIAPKFFDFIEEDMLNDLAAAFWCDPRELTIEVELIEEKEEESNESTT